MTTPAPAEVAEVLAGHGFASLEEARAGGLVYACVACGSVGGTDPAEGEAARVRTRDALDLTCCTEADTFLI